MEVIKGTGKMRCADIVAGNLKSLARDLRSGTWDGGEQGLADVLERQVKMLKKCKR